jgi:putative lipoprotein
LRYPYKFVCALLLIFGILSGTAMAEQRQLPVTVTYRERIALPPDAILEVELLDVSRADAPAVTLSHLRLKQDRVPFEVALPYDDALIDERMSYVVSARIISEGGVIFRTTSAYPVLTRDAPAGAELVLQRMPSSAAAQGQSVLVGIDWAAFEVRGRLLVAEDPPSITFEEDGSFALFGGCNRFAGKVEISNGMIAFPEVFAGTRRACQPERERLEKDILDALSASTRFDRNGVNVAFQAENGVVTVRFRERSR